MRDLFMVSISEPTPAGARRAASAAGGEAVSALSAELEGLSDLVLSKKLQQAAYFGTPLEIKLLLAVRHSAFS